MIKDSGVLPVHIVSSDYPPLYRALETRSIPVYFVSSPYLGAKPVCVLGSSYPGAEPVRVVSPSYTGAKPVYNVDGLSQPSDDDLELVAESD